ncbi:neuronal acetylcholine receptor subunit alpha-7-like [Mytilus galloprovincialis]|uniref:neuronal acetylcholine receptor subunit alpha-7-like n=1 Tax=Mytilus galloprovincialis TaxID=29158 RepID=UPI003F7B8F3B
MYWSRFLTMNNVHRQFVLNLICLSFLVKLCSTYSYTDVDILYKNLTSGYNKQIRPVIDQSEITYIDSSFNIITVQDISEVQGTVTLSGFFSFSWIDKNLAWNPADHNNIYTMDFPENVLWKPPMVNGNAAKNIKIMTVENMMLAVQEDGRVLFFPGDSFTFTCDIDSSKFPFDTQICTMDILTWGYSNETLVFNDGLVATDLMGTNSGWELSSATITGNVFGILAIPGVEVKFNFKRRSYFFIMNLLLPVNFLGFLNIFVFILPQESGERIGFSITALLAVVVFITIAEDILPATATPKLAALYELLIQDMALSGCIVISVILSSRIYYQKDQQAIPEWIRKCVGFKFCCCNKKHPYFNRHLTEPNSVHVLKSTDKIKVDLQKDENTNELTWETVSKFLDTVSLCFYLLWFIVGNMKFFIDTL